MYDFFSWPQGYCDAYVFIQCSRGSYSKTLSKRDTFVALNSKYLNILKIEVKFLTQAKFLISLKVFRILNESLGSPTKFRAHVCCDVEFQGCKNMCSVLIILNVLTRS